MSVFIAVLAIAGGIRIVSLAPALTEDLFAIGAGSRVVAVDAYSNRPSQARRLPRVGGMREVNAEAVLAMRPDLVVGIPYEAAHLADVHRGGVRTETFPLDSLSDDLHAIERLGIITGRAEQARRVAATIRARLATLSTAAHRARPLRAFVALGGMGSAGAGSYVDELLAMANLRNVAGRGRGPWITLSPEELLRAQPDVIVVPDRREPLTGEPWSRLSAVRAGRVVRIPEDDLLRPGPRVANVLADLIAGVRPWR